MNKELDETVQRLKELFKEQSTLQEKLSYSLAIATLWGTPGPKWPVFSSIIGAPSEDYCFNLRDSGGTIKNFNLDEVPDVLLNRPHIHKALTNRFKGGS
jgi:hypothetical protein